MDTLIDIAELADDLRRVTVEVTDADELLGSGLLWPPGHVVTNAHVVRRPEVTLRLSDGRSLRARVRALLRRTGAGDGVLHFADLTLDPSTREASRDGRRLQLTRTEFNLLELFLRNPRQVLTRSQIYERVWGYDFGATSNALWVYIGYLRRKLEEGGEPRLLQTVRGVGYALREEP